MYRVLFSVAITLSLALGAFSGVGTTLAFAASQPTAGAVMGPVASVPSGVGYCYPSGYNKEGWRCGWRLAQAPYNLGDYYNNYYYGSYYGGYYGGYPGYGGYGGYPGYGTCGYYGGYPYNHNGDYGGQPRFGNCYYNNYYNPYPYYGYH